MKGKFKKFAQYLRGSYSLALLSLLFALIATGSKLLIPFLAGKAINQLSSGSTKDVTTLIVIMFSLVALGTICRYLFDYMVGYLGARIIKKMRDDIFSALMNGKISSLKSGQTGDQILRIVNDVENVQNGFITGFATLYDGIITIATTIIFMFVLNWILALLVILLTPISILVSRFISKFNSKYFKAQARKAGEVNSFVHETVSNSETISQYGLSSIKNDEFAKINEEYRQNSLKANIGASIINPSTRLINALINATLVTVGAIMIIKDINIGTAFLIGDLSSFLTYASNYMQPFNEISDVLAEINYASASFSRIMEALSTEKENSKENKIPPKEIDSIEAENIYFSYDGEKMVIKNYSFSAKKGMKIAIVGPTGCGKTTILSLLMRFYDLNSGDFKINNQTVDEFDMKQYRGKFGMVLQEPWIFSGTVYENISYAKPGATREEVVEAAKKSQALGFIERLPNGFDTLISDSSGLSLGEKQLISVARVMLLSPDIIVLDEATSNIDIRTEFLLAKSFDELMKGKTTFVVAHRLSTIVNSDLIIVMKDGEIIEQGTHKELMEKNGFYHSMYSSQFC